MNDLRDRDNPHAIAKDQKTEPRDRDATTRDGDETENRSTRSRPLTTRSRTRGLLHQKTATTTEGSSLEIPRMDPRGPVNINQICTPTKIDIPDSMKSSECGFEVSLTRYPLRAILKKSFYQKTKIPPELPENHPNLLLDQKLPAEANRIDGNRI